MSRLGEPAASAAATLRARVLHPGDVACAASGERLETLLGSCVAVVLADPRRTVGAMCHVVHARPAPANAPNDTAYGDAALRAMAALLAARGIAAHLCHAWVYGGGNMFPGTYMRTHVGDANVRWVFEALAAQGIAVLDRNVGGTVYRRLAWTVGVEPPTVTLVPL